MAKENEPKERPPNKQAFGSSARFAKKGAAELASLKQSSLNPFLTPVLNCF